MAELGAIASIVGIAGAGAKLSISLYQFAETVGSARNEVRTIGTEISLFSAVLKQLHSTLTKARNFRYSITAIETTQDILDECQKVFEQISMIVEGLKTGKATPGDKSMDFVGRVKWAFQPVEGSVLEGNAGIVKTHASYDDDDDGFCAEACI